MRHIDNIRFNIYRYRFMIRNCIYFNDLDSYDYWSFALEEEIIKLTKELDSLGKGDSYIE